MFAIPRDSEAFRLLQSMINDPEVDYIRVSTNDNMTLGEGTPKAVCLAAGQGMWTYPLKVEEVGP